MTKERLSLGLLMTILVAGAIAPMAMPSAFATSTGVTLDNISDNDFINASATVTFTWAGGNATDGTIVFDRTGGSADTQDVHTYTLTGSELTQGQQSVTIATLNADSTFAGTNQLVDGAEYTVTVSSTDSSGISATATVVTYDITAPTAPNTPDMRASSDTGIVTDNITFTESSVGFDVGGVVVGDSVQLYIDGIATGSPVVATGTTVTLTSGTISTGIITAKSTDPAGNESSVSTGLAVTIDTVDPTVTLTVTDATLTPDSADGLTVGTATLNYSVEFSETTSDFVIGDITVTGTANGGSPVASNFAGSGTSYTFDVVRGSSDGTSVVVINAAAASDTAGNGNTASSTLTTTFNTVGTNIPVITLEDGNIAGGNPDSTILKGATWTDPGYTAYDIEDGYITGSVITNSTSVDTNVVGDVVVNYAVEDSHTNDAVNATRTVTVFEGSYPVITGVSDQSIAFNDVFTTTLATCTDTEDGTISTTLAPTGSVGASSGDYQLTYSCTDSSSLTTNLVITITRGESGGGDSDHEWMTAPTFGIDWNTHRQLVEDGITFNKNSYDVTDNFHTDFAKQPVMVGVNNVVAMKVFAQYDLKWVEFIFDVPETGKAHEARASIEIPMTWMDTDEVDQDNVRVVQDVNLINEDKLEVYRTSTTCTSDDTVEYCDLIAVKFPFNEQPKSGVFAIKAVDERNRSTTTYLNDGIEVTGDSLNEPETILVTNPDRSHRGLVELTQVGDRYDNLWSTSDGYTYTMNEYGTLLLVDAPESEVRVDSGDPRTRTHSAFNDLKAYEAAKAKYGTQEIVNHYVLDRATMEPMMVTSVSDNAFNADEIVSEGAPSYSYDFPTEDSRTQFLKEHNMLEFARGN